MDRNTSNTRLLRQNQLALAGFSKPIDLTFTLDPDFFTAASEGFKFDDFWQLWDRWIRSVILRRVSRMRCHFNFKPVKSGFNGGIVIDTYCQRLENGDNPSRC